MKYLAFAATLLLLYLGAGLPPPARADGPPAEAAPYHLYLPHIPWSQRPGAPRPTPSPPTPAPTSTPIRPPAASGWRINAGGDHYTDALGRAWAADTGFSGGSAYAVTTGIAATSDVGLYQNERYGEFSYHLTVPNGVYRVTLMFAEIYFGRPGERVFNVAIEGQPVLRDFDILDQTAPNTPLDRVFSAVVTDGRLDVEFTSVVNHAVVAAMAVEASQAPPPTPTPTPALGPNQVQWGVHMSGSPWDMSVQDRFEALVGKRASLINLGLAWMRGTAYQSFPTTTMEAITQRGATPVMFWFSGDRNLDQTTNQPLLRLAEITAGRHDGYVRDWARQARAWGKPFYLKFNAEMNGWWWPYSEQTNANRAGEFVAMWRHVVDIFRQEGATNAVWVWCPNIAGPNSTPLAQVFPGEAYVDWTCLDGYNWGGNEWETFAQVYGGSARRPFDSYHTLLSLAPSKPMMIGEFASAEGNDQGERKAAWIRDALEVQLPYHFPRIRAISWYHVQDGVNWPLDSSPAALAAFRRGIGLDYYQPGGRR